MTTDTVPRSLLTSNCVRSSASVSVNVVAATSCTFHAQQLSQQIINDRTCYTYFPDVQSYTPPTAVNVTLRRTSFKQHVILVSTLLLYLSVFIYFSANDCTDMYDVTISFRTVRYVTLICRSAFSFL
jgi:hypothetical protein